MLADIKKIRTLICSIIIILKNAGNGRLEDSDSHPTSPKAPTATFCSEEAHKCTDDRPMHHVQL